MIFFDMPWWLAAMYVFALGCVVGSFLNVCVHRLPMHHGYWKPLAGLWSPPSRCPKCFTPIRKTDNLPIIGWLRLRGRCRSCRTKISWRYPTIELFNGLLVVGLYFLNVPIERWSVMNDVSLTTPLGPFASDSLLNDQWLAHARFMFQWLLMELLLVAALIDADSMTIPAVCTDPWIVVGVACSAIGGLWLWPIDFVLPYGLAEPKLLNEVMKAQPDLVVPGWFRAHPVWHGVSVSLAGAFVGFSAVASIRWVGTKILGVEAVGAGDVWLMAMVGSFIGWQPVIIAMVLSLVFALGTVGVRLVTGRAGHFPYGPYLSLGSATTILAWPLIWPRTAQLFDLGPVFLGVLAVVMLAMLAGILGVLQVVKRVLGIQPYKEYGALDWRPADQHMYLAGERTKLDECQWKRSNVWSGTTSSRGQKFEQQWRGR